MVQLNSSQLVYLSSASDLNKELLFSISPQNKLNEFSLLSGDYYLQLHDYKEVLGRNYGFYILVTYVFSYIILRKFYFFTFILRLLRKIAKKEYKFCLACPSVCPNGTTSLPM